MREIIEENSEYLMDQDYAKVAMPEGYDRFRDLLEFGATGGGAYVGKVNKMSLALS